MRPIIIVGAGINGLTIGYQLARQGIKVVIIEKENQAGGLARTFHYGGMAFDIGPHRFFTQDKEILDFLLNILEGGYNTINRYSGVYFYNKYHTWPLNPKVIFDLPCHIGIKSALDLLLMGITNHKNSIVSFSDYILRNYGPTLYNCFFRDYTQKFLGIAPEQVSYEWAQVSMKKAVINEDVASRNLFDMLKLMFVPIPSEKAGFIYPKRGVGAFADKMAQDIEKHGGEILLGNQVNNIKISQNRVEGVFLKDKQYILAQDLIWTAPITDLTGILGISGINLKFLSLLLYNVELDEVCRNNYQWCYYGNKDVVFSRASIPALFDSQMSVFGKSGLCIEVSSMGSDSVWRNPEGIIPKIKDDLVKVGLVSAKERVKKVHIEKIDSAYPCYTIDYAKNLKQARDKIKNIENIILGGRSGLFWYNNMDESIRNGLAIAEEVMQKQVSYV